MKKYGWLAAILLIFAVSARAQKLPERMTYLIYIEGKKYGEAEIRVSYEGGDVILESTASLSREGVGVEINSRTVADAETYVVKSYRMSGMRGGQPYAADVAIDGKVIRFNENNPEGIRDTQIAQGEPVMVSEDFVVEHHLLMSRAHMETGEESRGYDILYPNAMMLSRISIGRASQSVVQSNIKESVCTKLILDPSASDKYASYYDPGRGVPVYLAFPAVRTEIFLDEFYGGEPVIRWRENSQ